MKVSFNLMMDGGKRFLAVLLDRDDVDRVKAAVLYMRMIVGLVSNHADQSKA